MEDAPLASLSLTHVHYNPHDPLSHISAYLALVPQALMITYVSLIWGTREIEIALMFAGQLGCEGLNWMLKRYIEEERPTQMHGKGYGMPSSHAQFVAYFSTFLTLFVLLRHNPHHPHTSTTHIPTPYWQRSALAVLSLLCVGAVAQSRIYLGYHTPRQVYAGVAAGVICAVGWFVVTSLARRLGMVDWILDLPLVRWMRFRDLVVNEDLVDPGWERWELRRQKRVAALEGKKAI
ncbi:DOLPP1 protein [Teratosphaeria nubilosa]|uniref:Dolichyldiphosphatase n=1 Tax=Teratosphaeria nubilosa TaxID=161662 RepID=A0A6G1LD39_9PEZI|nr:DOLPP1 protein [Teratosphaeria nubilosa]